MRRLVPLAVIALALTLSACGSGTTSVSTDAPTATGVKATKLIAASADKAATAKTARMSGEMTFDVDGETRTLPLDGALDFESGAFEFNYDMSALGLPGAGDAKFQARMIDGVMYLNFGSLAGESDGLGAITGGKTWAKMDLSSMLGTTGAGGGIGDANPTGGLDSLRGAGEVEKLGTETLRGVETTHYRAMVDPQKALEQAPPELREKARKGLETFKGPLPVEVWIDGDGQARKVAMNIEAGVGKVGMVFEYYDFGVDVDVSAPPADDVFDFSQFMGGMRPGGAGSPAV